MLLCMTDVLSQLNVEIPDELHRKLKFMSVEQKIPLRALVVFAIQDLLDKAENDE